MRLLLVLSLVFTVCPVRAQTPALDTGSTMLGGSVLFDRRGGDLYDEFVADQAVIRVDVRAGYFARPGFAFGADVTLDRLKQREGGSRTTFGVGPTVGYFVGNGASPAVPFATASALVVGRRVADQEETLAYYGGGLRATGGLAYFVGDHVALTAEVLFRFEMAALEGTTNYSSSTGLGLQFGLLAFLF